jgi:hypothetical protein
MSSPACAGGDTTSFSSFISTPPASSTPLFLGEWNGTIVHCCCTSGVKSPLLFEKIVA